MATSAGIALKRTVLDAVHRAAGAKMTEFGGWEMPVEYSGITQEHLAVRTSAGLFDVSHMGEVEVRGPKAQALLQYVTSNDVSQLKVFQAQYSALMYPQGSAVDDCVVHRLAEDHFLLCVNAANIDKDIDWIARHNTFGADIRNVSADYSQFAIQGPRAAEVLAKVADADLRGLKRYWFCGARCAGVEGLLARTGYTGEDGFEFYFSPAESVRVWNALLDAGGPLGLLPAGLGARNTLRLEAAYPLYGHELDEETTLLEANLGWICKLDKGQFIGQEALIEQARSGPRKKLVGLEMIDRGIARDGYPVLIDGKVVGRVTSGSPAPFLKKNVALTFVPPDLAAVGREVQVDVRGKPVNAQQVPLPFYKREN